MGKKPAQQTASATTTHPLPQNNFVDSLAKALINKLDFEQLSPQIAEALAPMVFERITPAFLASRILDENGEALVEAIVARLMDT